MRWLGFDTERTDTTVRLVSGILAHANVKRLNSMLFQFVNASVDMEMAGSFLSNVLGAIPLHVWDYSIVACECLLL